LRAPSAYAVVLDAERHVRRTNIELGRLRQGSYGNDSVISGTVSTARPLRVGGYIRF